MKTHVRLRWSLIDGVHMATRRGYVVRVFPDGIFSVRTPETGTVHTGKSKSLASAKRRARDLLVKLTPAARKKEQLSMRTR